MVEGAARGGGLPARGPSAGNEVQVHFLPSAVHTQKFAAAAAAAGGVEMKSPAALKLLL